MKTVLASILLSLSVNIVSAQQVTILPISLKNLSVEIKNETTVEVKWDIIHQVNASGYSIEHSMDSKNWQSVGFVPQVMNDKYKRFTFSHNNAVTGLHYYRIHLIENNEKLYYSEVRVVALKTSIKVSLWPNPSHNFVLVQCDGNKGINASAVLLNQNGIKLNEVALLPGINKIDIRKLPPGIYFIQYIGKEKDNIIIRFIKD
jgi:hypothetical protein